MPTPVTIKVPELQMSDLPKWAQTKTILKRVREDLAFRCNIFAAQSPEAGEDFVQAERYGGLSSIIAQIEKR